MCAAGPAARVCFSRRHPSWVAGFRRCQPLRLARGSTAFYGVWGLRVLACFLPAVGGTSQHVRLSPWSGPPPRVSPFPCRGVTSRPAGRVGEGSCPASVRCSRLGASYGGCQLSCAPRPRLVPASRANPVAAVRRSVSSHYATPSRGVNPKSQLRQDFSRCLPGCVSGLRVLEY